MGQRWPDGQKAVGPTSAANVGPTDVPTLGQRRTDGGMLSGTLLRYPGSENFNEITLSRTVKEIEAKLSFFSFSVKIPKFKMAPIFWGEEIFLKIAKSTLLGYPVGRKF